MNSLDSIRSRSAIPRICPSPAAEGACRQESLDWNPYDMCVYIYIYTYIQYIYYYAHTYIYIYIYRYLCMCICVYVYMCVYIYIYIYIYPAVHVTSSRPARPLRSSQGFIQVARAFYRTLDPQAFFIRTSLSLHIYIYIYIHICIYIYIYIHNGVPPACDGLQRAHHGEDRHLRAQNNSHTKNCQTKNLWVNIPKLLR